jgi:hypothetical protein
MNETVMTVGVSRKSEKCGSQQAVNVFTAGFVVQGVVMWFRLSSVQSENGMNTHSKCWAKN